MIVSVCLGGYNRILETRGLVNNPDLFFMVREAGQSKIRCQHGWLSALFLVLGQCLFHCVLRWQKGWGALWGVLHRNANAIPKAPSFMLFQRRHLLISSSSWIRIPTYGFWKDSIQTTAGYCGLQISLEMF